MIVGAPSWRNDDQIPVGSAFLYDLKTGELIEQFIAPNPRVISRFGWSVAISESACVVGSPWAFISNREKVGAAYVFDARNGDLLHSLTTPDATWNQRFGTDVDVSGELIGVSATFGEVGDDEPGNVKLFDLTSGQEVSELNPSDGDDRDGFGVSFSMHGNRIVIGSYNADTVLSGSGAAYVYDLQSFDEIAKIAAAEGQFGGWFGWPVAANSYGAIGATYRYDGAEDFAGRAYFFNWAKVEAQCPGDCAPLLGNGVVNVDDVIAVINAFGTFGRCNEAPATGPKIPEDDVVNIEDLMMVLRAIGECD
ncbi:MAG: FG-GAP repeat protein [Planctomycetota bacterium]